MRKAIKASLYKMFHDRALWICLAGTILWSVVAAYMQSWIADGQMNLTDPFLKAKYFRDVISYHCINVPLLTSMILLFSAEYKDRSWKLMIAKGMTQTGYYFAKLLCNLTLMVMISFCALVTGAAVGVLALGMPFDGALAAMTLQFFAGQCIAHGTVTILCFTIIFVMKNGEVSSCVNMLLLILGTMALAKMQAAMEWGDALTGAWAFSQFEYVVFGGETSWLRLSLVFVAYMAVCGLVVLFAARRDVE